jgi:ADP-ribosylglycohydrolase
MRRIVVFSLVLSLLALSACGPTEPAAPVTREIGILVLQDKIRGGWAGQMIGVSYGAPTEFRWKGEVIPEDKLPVWKPEMITNSINQDDIYVDVTFAEVLEKKGLNATTEDFGEMFMNSQYRLWHANLVGRRNLRRGIPAHQTGLPKFNAHANDIDFQIEADFVGLMAPGMPQASNDYCWRAGRVMNYGDGIYGGMFVCGMYSAAFFESDPKTLVDAGLACLPGESPYAQVIADTIRWAEENPTDWKKTWQLIQDKWDKNDPCPQGALDSFNIDAKLNGAYIALGMLYGGGDLEETIRISTMAGQDSDCNPASAAGVLGVVMGYDAIPAQFKEGIPEIADKKFSYTNHTFNSIVEITTQRAIELAQMHGGKFMGDTLSIETQEPLPAALEVWDDHGVPAERIAPADERWAWKGRWADQKGRREEVYKRSSTKGAEASVTFNGTGFILAGGYITSGGMMDIQLDAEPPVTVDAYMEGGDRHGESLMHRFDLAPGEHTVKLTVRGEPYSGSKEEKKGRNVVVKDLVVFRK